MGLNNNFNFPLGWIKYYVYRLSFGHFSRLVSGDTVSQHQDYVSVTSSGGLVKIQSVVDMHASCRVTMMSVCMGQIRFLHPTLTAWPTVECCSTTTMFPRSVPPPAVLWWLVATPYIQVIILAPVKKNNSWNRYTGAAGQARGQNPAFWKMASWNFLFWKIWTGKKKL